MKRKQLTVFAAVACLVLLACSSDALGQQDELPDNGFETNVQQPVDPASIPAPVVDDIARSDRQIVASKRLTEVIRNGGPLMIPIGICSFILVVFVFERLISLRKGAIVPKPFATRILDQLREGDLNREAAITLCHRNKSPLAKVLQAGFQKWGRPSVEVEQAILDEGERNSNHLRRYLRLINGIATVCPLLGLLGTVLGMIHAFDAIATVDSTIADPKTMIATGISQALLTTAAGMTVAIPALIAYLFFSSRVERLVMEIDAFGQKLVGLISAEGLAESKANDQRRQAAA